MRTYALIFCVLIFGGCVYDPPPQHTITIFNNSNSDIFVSTSCMDSLDRFYRERNYDTIKWRGKDIAVSPKYRVPKHKMEPAIDLPNQYYITKCPNGIINIFVISEQTMLERSWEEICKYNLFTKKIQRTYEQLESENWIVEYIPD